VRNEGPDGTGPSVILKDEKFVAELLGRDAITSGGMDSAHSSGKASGNGVSSPLAGVLRGDAAGTAPALAAL